MRERLENKTIIACFQPLPLPPALRSSQRISRHHRVHQSRHHVGVEDHHAHGGCRRNVADIVIMAFTNG
jgi:hypothetical protein